jgi:predicted RNA-binding Zn ribbon-like protein
MPSWRRRAVATRSPGRHPAWDGLGRPWWPVAQAAIDLLRSDRLPRLKGCARCSWLFLDQTKNRSRRWCSMADCGTAEKLRRRAAARVAQ